MNSKGDSSDIRSLIQLGKRVVVSVREGSAESLDLIEEYVSNFDSWEASWKAVAPGRIAQRDIGLAKRLATQHALIMKLAGEMRLRFIESLKDLRNRERGLKKYLGDTPQSVHSVNRKG